MTAVVSSAISDVTYEEDTEQLIVKFRSGRRYTYLAVPPSIYQALVDASSVGKFFNENVKDVYTAVE